MHHISDNLINIALIIAIVILSGLVLVMAISGATGHPQNEGTLDDSFALVKDDIRTLDGGFSQAQHSGGTTSKKGVVAATNEPTMITDVDDLQAMSEGLDGEYELGNDIDASETDTWNGGAGFEPVGTDSDPFTGSLDGNGYTITGLSIERTDSSDVGIGLFGHAEEAVVSNLTFEGATIEGYWRVGTLVGWSRGSVFTDITVDATVHSTDGQSGGLAGILREGNVLKRTHSAGVVGSEGSEVGGLVGSTDTVTVLHSTSESTVTSDDRVAGGLIGDDWGNSIFYEVEATGSVEAAGNIGGVGGLIGNLGGQSVLEEAVARGDVNAPGDNVPVGGLVGRTGWGALIFDSMAEGTVTGNNTRDVGGLVGATNNHATLIKSTATGSVFGGERFDDSNTGGLVGAADSSTTIVDSTAEGAVTAPGEAVGGLIGETSSAVTVVRSTAHGNVSGGDLGTGGLVGYLDESSSITDSSATGSVTSPGERIGGLVGEAEDGVTISSSTASGNVSGDTSGGLVGLLGLGSVVNDSVASGSVQGSSVVGGVVGELHGYVTESTGAETITGDSSVGGIVGEFGWPGASVVRSEAPGDVVGSTDVGGVVGYGTTRGSIVESTVTGSVSGTNEVGGLVGQNDAETSISNSTVWASVDGDTNVGGFVGEVDDYLSVAGSTVYGDVDGTTTVGGFVGDLTDDSSFVRSGAHGDVAGVSDVGGFVGKVDDASSFVDTEATGSVAGSSDVGGFVGRITDYAAFVESRASGPVEGTDNVGGFAGTVTVESSFVRSVASGPVDGETTVGGFAGEVSAPTSFVEVVASGNVEGEATVGGLLGSGIAGTSVAQSGANGTVTGGETTGGIAGVFNGTLARTVASGSLVSGTDDVGGLVGLGEPTLSQVYAISEVDGGGTGGGLIGRFVDGTVEAAYWDRDTSGQNDAVGTGESPGMVGLTTDEMTGTDADSVLIGFDFVDTWETTADYPALREPTDGFSPEATWNEVTYQPVAVTADEAEGTSGPTLDTMDGEGTLDDPYVITDASELQAMEESLRAHYELGNDIDLSGAGPFDPVGSATEPFNGTLRGEGHVITGLHLDNAGDSTVGLFAATEDALIQHVGLDAVELTAGDDSGALIGSATRTIIRGGFVNGTFTVGGSSGGVVGSASETIVREVNTSGSVEGDFRVGGLVGQLIGGNDITRSMANGTVADTGRGGGLIGSMDGGSVLARSQTSTLVEASGSRTAGLVAVSGGGSSIIQSTALGDVTNDWTRTGGLVGELEEGSTVAYGTAVGNVTQIGTSSRTGGLVGNAEDGTAIVQSSASGNVSSDGARVGGIVGYLADGSVVTDSKAQGVVEQVGGNDATGGFVGRIDDGATVYNSNATGAVDSDGSQTGGFAGFLRYGSTLAGSNAFGAVSGDGADGGFVGTIDTGSLAWNALATGNVTGTSGAVGGFVGEHQTGSLVVSGTAQGAVEQTGGSDGTGGFAGYGFQGVIHNSIATGGVESDGDEVGGFVGFSEGNSMIAFSTTDGAVTADGSDEVGGFVGLVDPSVFIETEAQGDVTARDEVGGFVGVSDSAAPYVSSVSHGTVSGTGENIGGFVGESSDHASYVDITVTSTVSGDSYVGGFAGYLNSESSVVAVTAEGSVGSTGFYAGGLIGYIDSSSAIVDSTAFGSVDGASVVGGLVGESQGVIVNSTAYGEVDGSNNVGGFVGYSNLNHLFVASTAYGNVSGADRVGGFAGDTGHSLAFVDSAAFGDVSGESDVGGFMGLGGGPGAYHRLQAVGNASASDVNAGGLIGRNQDAFSMLHSFALGSVEADAGVGGLIGNATPDTDSDTVSIAQSYATGSVTGEERVGGLIGEFSGTLSETYAIGEVAGGEVDVGGLIGKKGSLVHESYWDVNSTGQDTSDGGTGLTTEEMTGVIGVDTLGLEFAEIWVPTDEYPYLYYEPMDLSVDVEDPVIEVGNSTQTTGNLAVLYGRHSATGTTLMYTSSDPSVATVSETGIVDAVSGGTITIEGELAGLTDTAPLSVETSDDETDEEEEEEEEDEEEKEEEDDSSDDSGDGEVDSDDGDDVEASDEFFTVEILETNSPVHPGETLTVTAWIENTGNNVGNQTITLSVAGYEDSKPLQLDVGEQQTRQFDWTPTNDDVGNHTVVVASEDDQSVADIAVVAEPPRFVSGYVSEERPTVVETTFDQRVTLSGAVSEESGFAVGIDGESVGIESVQADGNNVELVLDQQVGEGHHVTFGYDGESDNLVNEFGLEALPFEAERLDNRVSTAFTAQLISIDPTTDEPVENISIEIARQEGVIFSTRHSILPAGEATYEWYLSDRQLESTDSQIVEQFDQLGNFTAEVLITVGEWSDFASREIEIIDEEPPTARVSATDRIAVDEDAGIDGSESEDNVAIALYEWEFGDGTTDSGPNLTQPEHAYGEPGEYTITLTVTDTSGNQDSNQTTVVVEESDSSGTAVLILSLLLLLLLLILLYYLYRRRRTEMEA